MLIAYTKPLATYYTYSNNIYIYNQISYSPTDIFETGTLNIPKRAEKKLKEIVKIGIATLFSDGNIKQVAVLQFHSPRAMDQLSGMWEETSGKNGFASLHNDFPWEFWDMK